MFRFSSNTKSASALITNQISAVARRGYAGAAPPAGESIDAVRAPSRPVKTPWVPDPVTGYYRPESQVDEIDAAELRAMLLRSKVRRD